MDQMNQGGAKVCGCPHHKVVPGLIVLFGLAFLALDFGWLSMAQVMWIWPVLIILGGLTKIFGSGCKCCSK